MPGKAQKPLKKKEVPVTLSIRFSPEDLKAIDREVERQQQGQPGFDFNRSAVVRHATLSWLRMQQKATAAQE
jgi:hypothetical protein